MSRGFFIGTENGANTALRPKRYGSQQVTGILHKVSAQETVLHEHAAQRLE